MARQFCFCKKKNENFKPRHQTKKEHKHRICALFANLTVVHHFVVLARLHDALKKFDFIDYIKKTHIHYVNHIANYDGIVVPCCVFAPPAPALFFCVHAGVA